MTHAEIEHPLLPASASLRCDALHVPASRRTGEAAWYDVFAVSEQCCVVSIGQLAGGADSAAIVAAVRAAFGPADAPGEPKALLAAANAAFRAAASGATFATAIVGIVDGADQTFTYVSAGHPPPIIRFHDGRVSPLPADGLPIGLAERDHPPAQVVVDLSGAALLVLYSSALVAATKDIGAGLARLEHVIADDRIAHCSRPAPWIARRMIGETSPDDAAVLALCFAPRAAPAARADGPIGNAPRWSVSWSFDSTGATSLGARRAFLACLSSKRGCVPLDTMSAELIFGELLGNVVRHAPGPVEIILDWNDELPVLHVLDNGPGFRSRRKRERLPVDEFSESGRGLFIVNACAVKFSVRNRNGRGTHASATLPPASA